MVLSLSYDMISFLVLFCYITIENNKKNIGFILSFTFLTFKEIQQHNLENLCILDLKVTVASVCR